MISSSQLPQSELASLADPQQYHAPLDLSGNDPVWLRAALDTMLIIRQSEECIAELVEKRETKAPCHLAIGQEAAAVGVARHVKQGDRVFGAHRSHAHYLALGGDVFELLAEVLGRLPGCSRGMGGSMHLTAPEHNLLGTVPLVGATIPLAVGAALAAQLDGGDALAVAFFGDGACEEGVLHESLNLASTMQLPVLFVCENNLFSSHLHISLRQPSDRVARYAEAHRMPTAVIDGNDVIAVAQATAQAAEHARNGRGPTFIEAVTYRWRGHVGHREDNDVGVRRNVDLDLWKRRDPIRRLATALIQASHLTDVEYVERQQHAADTVADAVRRARQAPWPRAEQLLGPVYAN